MMLRWIASGQLQKLRDSHVPFSEMPMATRPGRAVIDDPDGNPIELRQLSSVASQ